MDTDIHESVNEYGRRRGPSRPQTGSIEWTLPDESPWGEADVTVEFSYTAGTPAIGMHGPPEDSSPAEGPEIEITAIILPPHPASPGAKAIDVYGIVQEEFPGFIENLLETIAMGVNEGDYDYEPEYEPDMDL